MYVEYLLNDVIGSSDIPAPLVSLNPKMKAHIHVFIEIMKENSVTKVICIDCSLKLSDINETCKQNMLYKHEIIPHSTFV